MKNWAEMSKEESARIVKTFCELHESSDYKVREIADMLDISRESAGMLATLKTIDDGLPYQNKPRKTKRFSHRKSRSKR